MTQENFEQLLSWLDADRNQAGEKYEEIRRSLIKIFLWRGCRHAEDLADETFNRVAKKLQQVAQGYDGNPAHYCYGVARILIQEYLRKESRLEPEAATRETPAPTTEDTSAQDAQFACLELCLNKLSADNRDLLLLYYQWDGQEKIDFRKELAQELGLGMNAFRVRIHRLRTEVQQCLLACLKRGAQSA